MCFPIMDTEYFLEVEEIQTVQYEVVVQTTEEVLEIRDIFGEEDRLSPTFRVSSFRHHEKLPPAQETAATSSRAPKPRFISSILGGDIPYGARSHILTQAQRKEYPHAFDKTEPSGKNVTLIDEPLPQSPKKLAINKTESQPPTKDQRPTPPPSNEMVVRCSVIQRTPAATATCPAERGSNEDSDIPVSMLLNQQQHVEPEQDQPIDYHIPKRKDCGRGDDEEDKLKKLREARRQASAIIPSRSLLIRNLPRFALGKINGILAAAAGHGRSSNQNSQNGGNSSGGSSINFNGSGGGSSGGNGTNSGANNSGSGAMGGGGGSGAGGGMGGRDGRSNYGPNSPPTGSLPPFYESLKGGNSGLNGFNGNAGYMSNNYGMGNGNLGMDCDSTQELANLGVYGDGTMNMTSKQYSMLQNAYGIALKDEQDLDYETKVDPLTLNSNLLNSSYGSYDDSMMVDIGGVGVVDPLQFTATLTFSSPADHALLDSLSDAVDLSQFLQRLPNEDHENTQNELELSSTPSLTPDSVSVTPVEAASCLEPFPEHLIRGYERNAYTNNYGSNNNNNNKYHDNPPSYQTAARDIHHMLTQQQQQHSLHQQHSNGLHQQDHMLGGGGSNNNNNNNSNNHHQFDLDSHSNLSLPSPASVHSTHLDGSGHSDMYDGSPSTPAPTPQTIQNTIQNLGLPAEVQLEFVNGGHGIKNPLALENTHGRIRDEEKVKPAPSPICVAEDDPNKFVCRICSKTFTLQRLLNRHMKCHSDVKRYLCTFCGKGFNDTFDLKRHTRTHTGVRPYKCNLCEKSFTQRCSLESHCLKVHGVQHQYAYKERRTKMYVCEECGHTTSEPEVHYIHLKDKHPYSPALLKFYDKRHFKFTNSQFANNLLGSGFPMSVHN